MELKKGTVVWTKRALEKGEIYPREIYEIVGGKIYLSKFPHEAGFGKDELITDEIQALEIALKVCQKQRDNLDKKIALLKKRRNKAIQVRTKTFIEKNNDKKIIAA